MAQLQFISYLCTRNSVITTAVVDSSQNCRNKTLWFKNAVIIMGTMFRTNREPKTVPKPELWLELNVTRTDNMRMSLNPNQICAMGGKNIKEKKCVLPVLHKKI